MGRQAMTLTDADTAASLGTAVEVVLGTYHEVLAHLESANANTADADWDAPGGADGCLIVYDAAPSGVQVYVNEKETPDRRLQFVSPHDMDVYVPLRSGKLLRILDNDDAATDGVALYFDDDAATASARMYFVSPSDTDSTVETRGQLLSVAAE